MSSGRSSRVKMRSRPIDVNKPLNIADTSQREPDEAEIELALSTIPGGNSGHGGGGHGGGHHSGHTGQGDGMIAGADGVASIPTPPIFIDNDYHKRFDYGRFIQPSFYIKAHQTAGTGLINHLDRYDLLKEDIEWLAAYNQSAESKRPPGPTMTEDDMEKMIDLFEKEAGKITLNGMRAEMMSIEDKIDPRKDFPLVRAIVVAAQTIHVRTKILEPVYEYWIDKRKRLGKALMRQYQEPPPRGNVDPHVAFRLRTEGRRISKRNPRKDDHSGYHKMGYLKRDFQKILDIVENIQTREQLKRESSLLNIHMFDMKLHTTVWSQKLLREQTIVVQAIQQAQQSQSTMSSTSMSASSSAAGGGPTAFVPTLPPILTNATPEAIRTFRLLQSTQPPCTYSRQELEAEGRRRRAQNQHARASAAAAAAASVGQKRPNNLISIPRPRNANAGGGGGGGGAGGGSSDQRQRDKEARHKSRREYALGLGSLPPLEDEPEEMELTDEEDLLSEDEQDIKFYEQVEAHVKRMKLEREGGVTMSVDVGGGGNNNELGHDLVGMKTESYGSTTYSSYPPGVQHGHRLPPPPGAKVGYLSGVVGRGNLIWLECTWKPPTTTTTIGANPNTHQQSHTHTHGAQHHGQHHQHSTTGHAHHTGSAGHSHPPPSSHTSTAPLHISVVPPHTASHAGGSTHGAGVGSGASSTATPMEIDSRPSRTITPTVKAQ